MPGIVTASRDMKTRVCFTIDTEFSIGGAFAAPYDARPVGEAAVWCPVDGRSEGLGFLLDTFAAHGVQATFFVEALHRSYFSLQNLDPMRPAVDAIRAAGHDLQLHLHPCWTVFEQEDWPGVVGRQPRQDDFAGRPLASSIELIRRGQAQFADWGLPPPQVLRTGSLQHDRNTYRAIAACGLRAASNIGLGIYRSGDPDFDLYAGAHTIEGIVEFPVLSYVDVRLGARERLKSLTVTGSNVTETIALLEAAHASGLDAVVVLTHPFEYIRDYDAQFRGARTHARNQRKLAALCAHVREHSGRFGFATLSELLKTHDPRMPARNPRLRAPQHLALGRLLGNRLHDAGVWDR